MALTKCRECGGQVSSKADACPHCGVPLKKKRTGKGTGCLGCGGLLLLVIIGGMIMSSVSSSREAARKEQRRMEEQKRQSDIAQRRREAREKAKKEFGEAVEQHYQELANLAKGNFLDEAVKKLDAFKTYDFLDYKDVREIDTRVRTAHLVTRLKTVSATDYRQRAEIFSALSNMHPDNAEYAQQRDSYRQRHEKEESKRREAERVAQEERRKEEARKELIKRQFSAWGGSHRNLTAFIKKVMNDPDSYKHVETVYWDMGDHLIVKTTFRGKNAFGGVVANWIKAKVDMDGNVIEVIEQGP